MCIPHTFITFFITSFITFSKKRILLGIPISLVYSYSNLRSYLFLTASLSLGKIKLTF